MLKHLNIAVTAMEEAEVTLRLGEVEHRVDVDDVNPDDIKELFGINFEVVQLLEVESKKTVLIKKREKIKPGHTYIIQPPPSAAPAFGGDIRTPEFTWITDNHETIQTALVVSQAVYESSACDYLLVNLKNHQLKSVLRSENSDCHFLLAEEVDTDRVYLSFRGTEDTRDLTEDLKIYQRAAENGKSRGKFHAGFLSRSEMFPLVKILTSEKLRQKKLVVCGHSLGGAISSIVTADILAEQARRERTTSGRFVCDVINITFGSPLFGDEDVRRYLQERKFSEKMFHFVAEKDPVPSLLSLAQSVSAVRSRLDSQIRGLVGTVHTLGGQSYLEEKKNSLIQKKEDYLSFLSSVGPFISPALDLAAFVSPSKAGTAKLFLEGLNMILKGADDTKSQEIRRVYIPIGNFFFLNEDKKKSKVLNTQQFNTVTSCLDILREVNVEDCLASHKLKNYMNICAANECYQVDYYPSVREFLIPDSDGDSLVITEARTVTAWTDFTPRVVRAELASVTGPELSILRLALEGENLAEISLPFCIFDFGFPFGVNDLATIKKIPGNVSEKIVIEQAVCLSNLSISDHGANIHIATMFGTCDFVLQRKNVRNIKLQSISQISKHESISLVIKKSVQRGMALAQLKDKTAVTEPILTEILNLSEKSLPKGEHERLVSTFMDNTKNIQFILSNQDEYEKVSELCNKIENFMRSPIEIHAEKSLLQYLTIGALSVLGGGAVAYLAGPGLLLIGAVEAVNVGGAVTAGVAGSAGAGYAANRFLTEAMADRNYVQVLKWITAELFKVYSPRMKDVNPSKLQEVSDLRDDDSIYSSEKALLLMFDKEKAIENFNGSGIEKSTEKSKLDLLKRIECIEIVHKIRNILATQCFIGLVGLQDSGKTTLINKIWGYHGQTGLFTHTEVPVLHQVNGKVHIIDFPGSNSLDYHSKTFSICGAMNNMIIVLVPFSGDISEVVSLEVARVFQVMAGSESSRIVVCINKCGLHLDKLKEELKDQEDPINFMKERYVSKLTEHFSGGYIRVRKEQFFFTDWELSEEGKIFGIEGVEDIKESIKDHLIELNVIGKDDISELESAVSPPSYCRV